MLPSGPVVIAVGWALGVGIANSLTTPAGVIRPILSAAVSVKKRLPSGPLVIPVVSLAAGTGKTLRDIKVRSSIPSSVGRLRAGVRLRRPLPRRESRRKRALNMLNLLKVGNEG